MSRYPSDEWVAVVHPSPPHLVKVETKDRVIFDGFTGELGNAQLAAASKELHAALLALTEWGCTYTGPQDPNSPHELLIAARRAIAKAEGRAEA